MAPQGFFRRVAHFLSGEKQSADAKPPVFLAFRSSKGFIAATVCIAIFTDILLYGIIVPVLPFAMTSRIGIPEDSLQRWNAILLACYTITLFVGSPIAGVYADHSSSRRWPLLIGLLALAASTLLLFLGRTVALFVLGRLLQGASAAIVWSVGLALLADTFGDNIGMAMGYSSIAMSLGLLVSPVIGGAVFDNLGYYPVYYISFGCIFLDIILRLVLIEKKVALQWMGNEEPESQLVEDASARRHETTMSSESSPEIMTPEKRKEEEQGERREANQNDEIGTVATPAASVTAAGGLMAKYPKLRLIKSGRILAANWGITMMSGVQFSWDTVLPLYVRSTFHWSSTAAGLIFFCIFIPGFVAPAVGWLSDRYGAKRLALAGFVGSIPVLVCMRFVTEDTIGQKVLLGALLALLGLILTFSGTPLMAEITYAIEAEEVKTPGIFGATGAYGFGYGLFCTSWALGGTIGSLMSGYVMAGAGWQTLTWVLAVWMAGGAVVVALAAGGEPAVKKAPGDVESSSQDCGGLSQSVGAGLRDSGNKRAEHVAHAV